MPVSKRHPKRRLKLAKGQPKAHPVGGIARKGEAFRRQLGATIVGDRVWKYHATRGWLNRAF